MQRSHFLSCVVIVVAVLAVHANGLHGPFVFDDVTSIAGNPAVHSLWPPWNALRTPPDRTVSGRPVAAVTLALNHAVGGLDPFGYHLFNVLLHAGNALLAFTLLRRTLAAGAIGEGAAAGSTPIAAAGALLWAVHPLAGSCVTYVIQRTELLAGAFLLIALLAVQAASRSVKPAKWSALAIGSCVLGMGSKEVMVVAPILLLLFDGVFLAPSFRDALARRRGLYLGLCCAWVVPLALLATDPHGASAGFALPGLSAWTYARMQPEVILHYVSLALWPWPLSIDYSDWPASVTLARAIPAALAVGTLVLLSVWALVRRSWAGFLGAWFFLLLAPSSSFYPLLREPAAERRMYLPLLALVLLAVAAGSRALRALRAPSTRRALAVVAVGGAVIALGATTARRNRDFRSELALWQATVGTRPASARARNNYGFALFRAGRIADAVPQLKQAIAIEPGYAEARSNLGAALYTAGRVAEAIPQLEEAVRLDRDRVEAHFNLALAYHVQGRLPDAAREYREVLRLSPDDVDARNNLESILPR